MTFHDRESRHHIINIIYLISSLLLALTVVVSCGRLPHEDKVLAETLKKRLDMSPIGEVIHNDSLVVFSTLREKYSFISVVYLQEGCAPCYPKFIEWHQRIDTIDKASDYAVLFVINTRHYDIFRRDLSRYGEVEEKYYYYVDSDNSFLTANRSIPRGLIDRSLLIDRDNRIRMIGTPFVTPEMTALFHFLTDK